MLALGVRDQQIGLIASIGLVLQILFALLSGAITDKVGRKRATLITDLVSWSIPCLIWAFAQDFNWFLAAAIVNSVWRISSNSWMCLLVEDAEQDQLVHIYSWIYISGLLVAFFSPAAGLLIRIFSLIPTVRGLFLLAFVMMTAKFLIMNHFVTETRQGVIRMEETRHQPLLSLLSGYRGVLTTILKTPQTLFTLGIMLVMSICNTINGTFWSILVTKKLHIPVGDISLYPFARASVMLLFFFLVIPRLNSRRFKKPMMVGFAGFVLSQTLLITMPEKSYLLLLVATVFEACSAALVSPFMDSMIVVTVDPAERARIMAILYVVVITMTSPFGWIAGKLSEVDRSLPFALNLALFTIGGLLVLLTAWRATRESNASQLSG
jgi:MFS family permease